MSMKQGGSAFARCEGEPGPGGRVLGGGSATSRSEAPQGMQRMRCITGGSMSTKQERSATSRSEAPQGCCTGGAA